MKKFLASLLAATLLVGCSSVVPKKVEFFQDKVESYPSPKESTRQLEKQLVQRMHQKAAETVQAAVAENASTNVVTPAREVERLAAAEAVVVGPPETPATIASEALAVKLETAIAKFDTKVEAFKAANNENIGKAIEGTGVFQFSYIGWVGGILAVLFVLFFVGKLLLSVAALANPGAAVGLNVVNGLGAIAAKGFSQLVKGGEEFKSWVNKEVQDADLKERILDGFMSSQMKAQDSDVQNAVMSVTK